MYVGTINGVDVVDQHADGPTNFHDDWWPNSADFNGGPARAEFVHLKYPCQQEAMMTKRRWIMLGVALLTLITIAAVALIVLLRAEDDTPPNIEHFNVAEQYRKAQMIIERLNHDVSQVEVLRGNDPDHPGHPVADPAQDRTIRAAMPGPGCHYRLFSVEDRGEQGTQPVPPTPPPSTTAPKAATRTQYAGSPSAPSHDERADR